MFIKHMDIKQEFETLEYFLLRWSLDQSEIDLVISKFKEIININK